MVIKCRQSKLIVSSMNSDTPNGPPHQGWADPCHLGQGSGAWPLHPLSIFWSGGWSVLQHPWFLPPRRNQVPRKEGPAWCHLHQFHGWERFSVWATVVVFGWEMGRKLHYICHIHTEQHLIHLSFYFHIEQDAPTKITEEINWCGNHWRYPASCTPGEDCQYYARWEYDEASDYINFKVQTSHTNLWTGIGFTDNTRMVCTMVLWLLVICLGNFS